MTHNVVKDFYYSVFPNASKYLTFDVGDTDVVLSAPHGGGIKPRDIPVRKYGNRSQDTYTRRVIQKIVDGMGENPYYVYADIHRSRVDLNRDKVEAAQGNKEMEKVWKNWNNILSYYTNSVSYIYKRGIYVDIHSHSKSDLFEIGYGLSVTDYQRAKRNYEKLSKNSTMFSILGNRFTEHEVLFGDGSFPDTIEKFGFKVLNPKNDSTYLNGGRDITNYCGSGVGAIQIECPMSVLKTDLDKVAYTILNAIYIFKECFINVSPLSNETSGES